MPFGGQGGYESVQKFLQLQQPRHGQPRTCDDRHRACFRSRHPRREQVREAATPSYQNMRRAIVVMTTNNDEALTAQRMKRIPDNDFRYRNQGTMNPLPIAVVSVLLPCTASSSRPR
jgi:hypothetical protein